MSIRTMVSDILDGKQVHNVPCNLNHCYDALRQSIMCRADATPLYVPKDTFFAGDGQHRQCGDWEALQEWVIQHTACYNSVLSGRKSCENVKMCASPLESEE